MIKKDWVGYGAKYEEKFGIFSRLMLSGGQKHHFLQDSEHISKFCAVYQILRKITRAQNPGGTVQNVFFHCYIMTSEKSRIFFSKQFQPSPLNING